MESPGKGMEVRDLRGLRILVVEDDWMTTRVISSAIKSVDAEVVGPFSDVEQAMSAIAKEKPHIAILDLRLEERLVDDVANMLVECSVPYVVVTGYHVLPTWADRNSKDVIRKPLTTVAIVETLRRAIHSASEPQRRSF